mgnify:CR=1 FL=1
MILDEPTAGLDPLASEILKEKIHYDFMKDNNFTELKETELLTNRLGTLQLLDPYVGRYYSMEWARKNVLQQTEEDIQEIDQQIANEQQQLIKAQQMQGIGVDITWLDDVGGRGIHHDLHHAKGGDQKTP